MSAAWLDPLVNIDMARPIDLDQTAAGTGEYLRTIASEWGEETSHLYHWSDRQLSGLQPYDNLKNNLRRLGLAGPRTDDDTRLVDVSSINQRVQHLGLSFDYEMTETQLRAVIRTREDQLARESVYHRARAHDSYGTAKWLAGGLVDFMVQVADPANIVTALIPVVGEAKFGALAARLMGRAAGPNLRAFARGAAEGAISTAAFEPLFYLARREVDPDAGLADSIFSIALGGTIGGGVHWLGSLWKHGIVPARPADTAGDRQQRLEAFRRAQEQAAAAARGAAAPPPPPPTPDVRGAAAPPPPPPSPPPAPPAGPVTTAPGQPSGRIATPWGFAPATAGRGAPGATVIETTAASAADPVTIATRARPEVPQATAAAVQATSAETRQKVLSTGIAQAAQDQRIDIAPILAGDPAWQPPPPLRVGRETPRTTRQSLQRGLELVRTALDNLLAPSPVPGGFAPRPDTMAVARNLARGQSAFNLRGELARQRGRSLSQWVRARGGLDADAPEASELRAQNLDKTGLLRPKKYQGISQTRLEGHSADDLLSAAVEAGFFPEERRRRESGSYSADLMHIGDFMAAVIEDAQAVAASAVQGRTKTAARRQREKDAYDKAYTAAYNKALKAGATADDAAEAAQAAGEATRKPIGQRGTSRGMEGRGLYYADEDAVAAYDAAAAYNQEIARYFAERGVDPATLDARTIAWLLELDEDSRHIQTLLRAVDAMDDDTSLAVMQAIHDAHLRAEDAMLAQTERQLAADARREEIDPFSDEALAAVGPVEPRRRRRETAETAEETQGAPPTLEELERLWAETPEADIVARTGDEIDGQDAGRAAETRGDTGPVDENAPDVAGGAPVDGRPAGPDTLADQAAAETPGLRGVDEGAQGAGRAAGAQAAAEPAGQPDQGLTETQRRQRSLRQAERSRAEAEARSAIDGTVERVAFIKSAKKFGVPALEIEVGRNAAGEWTVRGGFMMPDSSGEGWAWSEGHHDRTAAIIELADKIADAMEARLVRNPDDKPARAIQSELDTLFARLGVDADPRPPEARAAAQAEARGETREAMPAQRETPPAEEAGAEGLPQMVIPGAERISGREEAERTMAAPLRGGAAAPPAGGLFDTDAQRQADLLDMATAERVSEKLTTADGDAFMKRQGEPAGEIGVDPELARYIEAEARAAETRKDAEAELAAVREIAGPLDERTTAELDQAGTLFDEEITAIDTLGTCGFGGGGEP